MSWDIVILNFAGKTPPPLEELRETDLVPLGQAAAVRTQISALLPGVDWSNPAWGIYGSDNSSIEFNAGNDDPIMSIMLHVRGDVISAIARFAQPLGWSALDCSTSEFLDLDSPSQVGWEGFQKYRDKIVGKYREENSS